MDNDFKQSVLEVLPTLPWVPTEQYLVDVMFEGSPQENESDTCIAELVDLGPPEGEHTCIISEVCDDIIIDMEKPCHGYPLTHKLSNVYNNTTWAPPPKLNAILIDPFLQLLLLGPGSPNCASLCI